MTGLVLLLGGGIGLGIYLLIRALIPPQPALGAALDRLTGATVPLEAAEALAPQGIEERVGRWVERMAAHVPMLVLPQRDLAVIGWSSRRFYGQKGMAALLGFVFPIVVSLFALVLGFGLPFVATIGLMLVLAVVFFFLPDLEVRQRAAKQRLLYAKALAAYIDFVALSRIGGASATQAMRDAAHVGDSDLFLRIRQVIERSRLRGTNAWGDMRELADELGVKELHEIADIVRLSGEEGASIWENLRAHAHSMRNAQLRTEQGAANARSEAMAMPLAVLALAFIGLLLAPSILKILAS